MMMEKIVTKKLQFSRTRTSKIMLWDLWDPPFIEVVPESSSCMQPRCQYDFHRDVLEEDALNEMACIQVLRILVRKAHDEIDELEKHLARLQNELACTGDEQWSTNCCNALKEKSNHLGVSLNRLSRDQDVAGTCSNKHKEFAERTAERTQDTLTALAGSCDLEKMQPRDTTIKNSSLIVHGGESSESWSIVRICGSKLDDGGDVDNGSDYSTVTEGDRIIDSPLKWQEKFSGCNELSEAINGHSTGDALKHVNDCINNFMPKIALNDRIRVPDIALANMDGLSDSSLTVKVESENYDAESSSLTSVMELHGERSEDVTKRHPKEEIFAAVLQPDDAAGADKANLNLTGSPQKPNREMAPNMSSKTLWPTEVTPRVSLPNATEQLTFGCENESASFNKPSSGMILKELVLSIHDEVKHPVLASADSARLASQPPRKRKKTSNQVTSVGISDASVKIEFSHEGRVGLIDEAKPVISKYDDDLDTEAGRSLCPPEVNLKNMKLVDLRAIAKEKKLKKYYRLPKSVLVEQIANKTGGY